MNRKHIIVLNTILEQLDSHFGIKDGPCILPLLEVSDILNETSAESLIELLVGLVLAEVEDIVDVLDGLLDMLLL